MNQFVEEINQKLQNLNKQLNLWLIKKKEEENKLKDLSKRQEAEVKSQVLLQQIAKEIQTNLHERLTKPVTKCLEAIGSDYKFEIKIETKRGKIDASLIFLRDGQEVSPENVGGGILDLSSFALQLSCLLLKQPKPRSLIILDEPFRHLSKDHSESVANLLLELSDTIGIQFVIVTHNEDLKVGKVITIE